MNTQAQPRAATLANTFDVWRIAATDGVTFRKGELILVDAAGSLEEARVAGLMATPHKGFFVVRETDAMTGEATAHLFTVKQQSKPVWRRSASDMAHAVQVRPLYAEHVTDLLLAGLFGDRP